MPEILEQRRKESSEGLEQVRAGARDRLVQIVGDEPLAIYATGSFGRHEAVFPRGSDLDLFFLYDPKDQNPSGELGRLVFFELAAELIKLARELDFEEFSGDGEYLKVHNVRYIGEQLGSRHEDAENGFTARLLLLLESEPIFNEELYARMLSEVVGFYFEDYGANAGSFRPTFLLNDIMRFWRTLCLNYEHKRRSKRLAAGSNEHDAWRAKSALDNFKLRFSRLSTCYSMVAALSSEPTPVSPERVVALCGLPPSDRWDVAVENAAQSPPAHAAAELRDQMAAHYDFFLEATADKAKALERLGEQDERQDLRQRAAAYGELVSQLLVSTCRDDQRRTLFV